jgi:hypothetical protein
MFSVSGPHVQGPLHGPLGAVDLRVVPVGVRRPVDAREREREPGVDAALAAAERVVQDGDLVVEITLGHPADRPVRRDTWTQTGTSREVRVVRASRLTRSERLVAAGSRSCAAAPQRLPAPRAWSGC